MLAIKQLTYPRWRMLVPSAETPELAGSGSRYKWIALSNTTLGMLMATVNSSIMLIALPDIDRKSTRLNSSHATLPRMPSSA